MVNSNSILVCNNISIVTITIITVYYSNRILTIITGVIVTIITVIELLVIHKGQFRMECHGFQVRLLYILFGWNILEKRLAGFLAFFAFRLVAMARNARWEVLESNANFHWGSKLRSPPPWKN